VSKSNQMTFVAFKKLATLPARRHLWLARNILAVQQRSMFKIALGLAAVLALPGCIPFVGGGTGYPDTLPGYLPVALTQQEPAAVAACIGRLMGVQPTSGATNEYVVSNGADSQVEYAVRPITKKGYTQTQVMVRDTKLAPNDSNVVRCASNANYVVTPGA